MLMVVLISHPSLNPSPSKGREAEMLSDGKGMKTPSPGLSRRETS
jgi:hypothetical protein